MRRMLTTFKRGSRSQSAARGEPEDISPSPDDSPETAIIKAVKAFCASGGPGASAPGEEVLHLPTIVDSAESSPTAAKEAASVIRKQLDLKHNSTRPYMQYNAIMLLRILSDNPGRTFTRNLSEPKFAGAVKDLLRQGRDPSVRQILGETLEYFEVSKGDDEGLRTLKEIWIKEKKNIGLGSRGHHSQSSPPMMSPQNFPTNYTPRSPAHHNGLPTMEELVARIAEAQTSAKLLEQVLQSTPPAEVPTNDLVKEFADRCKSASRSMVAYIQATDPSPDEDTLTTLIETNDVLSMALDRHKKVVKTALEKLERAQTENSRILNVDEGEPLFTNDANVAKEENAGNRASDMERVPDSPVSPVSPEHPMNYRY